MNVSSSTSTSNSVAQASASACATNGKQPNDASKSFGEEMKNVDLSENKENNVAQNEDISNQKKEDISHNATGFDMKNGLNKNKLNDTSDMDFNMSSNMNTSDLLSLNIQQLLETQHKLSGTTQLFNLNVMTSVDLSKNVGHSLDFSSLVMSEDDAQFFIDIVKNNSEGLQNVVQDVQQALEFGTEKIQKSANISKTLLNALHNSVNTGQAVRIDFGNDIAVVLRVGKDGAIMANFIPGDKAVEEYLKNNISFLKQRFDEDDIPYSQLSYSQHQQRRQQNNKENKHE